MVLEEEAPHDIVPCQNDTSQHHGQSIVLGKSRLHLSDEPGYPTKQISDSVDRSVNHKFVDSSPEGSSQPFDRLDKEHLVGFIDVVFVVDPSIQSLPRLGHPFRKGRVLDIQEVSDPNAGESDDYREGHEKDFKGCGVTACFSTRCPGRGDE